MWCQDCLQKQPCATAGLRKTVAELHNEVTVPLLPVPEFPVGSRIPPSDLKSLLQPSHKFWKHAHQDYHENPRGRHSLTKTEQPPSKRLTHRSLQFLFLNFGQKLDGEPQRLSFPLAFFSADSPALRFGFYGWLEICDLLPGLDLCRSGIKSSQKPAPFTTQHARLSIR